MILDDAKPAAYWDAGFAREKGPPRLAHDAGFGHRQPLGNCPSRRVVSLGSGLSLKWGAIAGPESAERASEGALHRSFTRNLALSQV